MKKIMLACLVGVVLVICFFLFSPQFETKRNALFSVGNTLVEAPYHQAVIVEGGGRALKAKYNHATIARATEYMGTFGSGTRVYREIARIASEADMECPLLDQVLDLAARSTRDAGAILALAERACEVQGTGGEADWLAEFEVLSQWAEYPSVEAAIAAQPEG